MPFANPSSQTIQQADCCEVPGSASRSDTAHANSKAPGTCPWLIGMPYANPLLQKFIQQADRWEASVPATMLFIHSAQHMLEPSGADQDAPCYPSLQILQLRSARASRCGSKAAEQLCGTDLNTLDWSFSANHPAGRLIVVRCRL